MEGDAGLILDEFGARWKVKGGDPGSKVVNRLKRSGYEFVVLPLVTLATGSVTPPVEWPAGIIERTRLADCLAVLSEA